MDFNYFKLQVNRCVDVEIMVCCVKMRDWVLIKLVLFQWKIVQWFLVKINLNIFFLREISISDDVVNMVINVKFFGKNYWFFCL